MLVDYNKDMALPGMLTVSEVADILHVHPNTVRLWSDAGLLKTYRIGYRRDRRFKPQDIDAFLMCSEQYKS